ncbi:MAG: hypothetical protein Fur002_05090 [Anaerolineales bacterium]
MMKILVVGNYYYPEHIGGVEVVSRQLVRYYHVFGAEVRWMAADVSSRRRVIQAGDAPICAWNFTEEKLGFPQPLPIPFTGAFWRILREVAWCDVVHLQDCLYVINTLVFLCAKIMGKPVLLTQYAKRIPYAQKYKNFLQDIGYVTVGRFIFCTVERMAFITENVRDGMSSFTPLEKRVVVPLGVDTEIYTPLPDEERREFRRTVSGSDDKPLILFVGRLVERKGVHLLPPIIEKHPDWFWVFVGRPDDFNPSDWGYANVKHLQNLDEDELRRFFAAADVLVHPSVGEGVTLTVSNSLSCGTPAIISKESIENISAEIQSVLLPVSPNTQEVEQALTQILADRSALNKMRAACRIYAVRRLSWEKMCKTYFEILEHIGNKK